MASEAVIIGQIEHEGSGLTVDVLEHGTKRFTYSASVLGFAFKAPKRDKLEAQVSAHLDQIAALDWTPIIEAYTRYTASGAAFLSLDRYWILQLPAGELIRANWRADYDDNRSRIQRCYIASLPAGFGAPFPVIEKSADRQRVWMLFAENTWGSLQQSVARLRSMSAPPIESSPQAKQTVFMPPRVTRYEIHYQTLEALIREHLDLDYSILNGERWSPDGSNVLQVSLDGYDDSDRAVIEQVRSGDREYFALEMLMRVLVEKHVLPEGQYLIMARQD